MRRPDSTATAAPEEAPRRRYRVCQQHCTLLSVMIGGVLQRFCQQCARFQPVSAFEGERRSCCAALARHRKKRRSSGVRRRAIPAKAADAETKDASEVSAGSASGMSGEGGRCAAAKAGGPPQPPQPSPPQLPQSPLLPASPRMALQPKPAVPAACAEAMLSSSHSGHSGSSEVLALRQSAHSWRAAPYTAGWEDGLQRWQQQRQQQQQQHDAWSCTEPTACAQQRPPADWGAVPAAGWERSTSPWLPQVPSADALLQAIPAPHVAGIAGPPCSSQIGAEPWLEALLDDPFDALLARQHW
ncbi:hypothetical protein ABPG75_008733 [Micractinium tetrahymenae]